MWILVKAAVLVASLAVPSFSSAAESPAKYTAGELLSLCSGDGSSSEKCALFIAGVRSGMQVQREFIGFNLAKRGPGLSPEGQADLLLALTLNEPLCSSRPVTQEQLAEAFVANMQTDTQRPHLSETNAGTVLLLAWRQAHCQKSAEP
ncbi:Rap1a/Tai family immunity protein [Lysobacter cavernae]|uniref:Rap1a/Tai family immunity protein n=1 Tax=Lysobacter cavernae TaxID=1685901 RepID=A0ABV7RWC4_9GAMM